MIFYCKVILTKTTESYFFFSSSFILHFFFSVQKAVRAKVMPSQKVWHTWSGPTKSHDSSHLRGTAAKPLELNLLKCRPPKNKQTEKNKTGRIFFTEVLVRVIWCSESPSTGTQEENQQNTRNKLNPSDPEIKTDSELEHWLFRLVWLFHTHPSAFWAWTVICTRSDYVNMSMHRNACFSVFCVGGRRRM